MKTIRHLTGLLALGFAAGFAQATTFDFSYVFADGTAITGTLEGNQAGSFVDNVTNVSLLFNGDAVAGAVFASQYDGSGFVASPVVSFDAAQSNFYFATSDLVAGDFGFDALFALTTLDGLATAVFPAGSAQEATVGASWTLTAQGPATVPEGGLTLALFGTSVAGLGCLRRRLQAGRMLATV